MIVVDKPAGLLTIATAKEKRRTAYAVLFDYVKRKRTRERLFIVHRLDREASGLLVFAKSEPAKRNILGGNARRLFNLDPVLSDVKTRRLAERG